MTVAAKVAASVVMASAHRPVPMIRARQTAAPIAARRLPTITASATMTAQTSHQGESVSSVWNGLRTL